MSFVCKQTASFPKENKLALVITDNVHNRPDVLDPMQTVILKVIDNANKGGLFVDPKGNIGCQSMTLWFIAHSRLLTFNRYSFKFQLNKALHHRVSQFTI